MDIESRLKLVEGVGEEIITRDELKQLLETKAHPVAYDGFEPSGICHLGSGLLRAIQLNDFLGAGIKFKLWIADYFAWINNKMGGDLELIKTSGKYMIEVWKACGIDVKKADVLWASDAIKDPEYWKLVISVAKLTTIERMVRASTIMGRKEAEMQYTSQLFYPAMQTADPFHLGVDILQLGVDQRKCGVLSREIGPRLGLWKPVCVYHHLLIGLQGPTKMGGFEKEKKMDEEISSKMSKSIPKSFISMHDSQQEINDKIMSAFCPPKEIESNPILEICKYIILKKFHSIQITRKKSGDVLEFQSPAELEKAYRAGQIHPFDLKIAVIEYLDKAIRPIREHFETGKAEELYRAVRDGKITR